MTASRSRQTTTGYLLAGALLGDLVVRGRVDLAGPGEAVPAGGVLVRSLMPTGDDLLDDALERVRRREGGRPSSVIRPLSKGTRSAVLERLTAAGVVGASTRRVLGIFSVRSWPPVSPRSAARARRAVQTVVESRARPDPEAAMLISLLVVGGVLHKVLPTTDRKAQLRRAQHLVQDNWVASATRKALQDIAAGAAGLAVLPGLLGFLNCHLGCGGPAVRSGGPVATTAGREG